MRSVLDTSVVIADTVRGLEGQLAVSAVTLAELHTGVLVARDTTTRASRLHRLATVERLFEALPLDNNVARSYGRLAAVLRAAGRSPRSRIMDLLIAATAHAHDARLYTANPEDVRGLESELEIVVVSAA